MFIHGSQAVGSARSFWYFGKERLFKITFDQKVKQKTTLVRKNVGGAFRNFWEPDWAEPKPRMYQCIITQYSCTITKHYCIIIMKLSLSVKHTNKTILLTSTVAFSWPALDKITRLPNSNSYSLIPSTTQLIIVWFKRLIPFKLRAFLQDTIGETWRITRNLSNTEVNRRILTKRDSKLLERSVFV